MEDVNDFVPYDPKSVIVSAWWSIDEGRFNLCSNEKDFQLIARFNLENGTHLAISELWPIDKAPDVDNDTPIMDVVELISERLKTYWISTSRPSTRGKIRWVQENHLYATRAWTTTRIASVQKKADSLNDQLKSLKYTLAEIEEEILASKSDTPA